MKGKENREWSMSQHNNVYFKDEKIINDGKKKKKEIKLKYHALMISLSQTCSVKFSQLWIFQIHTFKEPMTTKQNEVPYILMTQHLVSDENKIIYFYTYFTITIIYYCIVILSFCHKYSYIFILTTRS